MKRKKKILIRILAVVFALLTLGSAVMFAMQTHVESYYSLYDEMILNHPFKTVFIDKPIWEYYSSKPDWYEPYPTVYTLDKYFEAHAKKLPNGSNEKELVVMRGEFVTKKHNRRLDRYYFNVNWYDDKIKLSSNEAVLVYKELGDKIYKYGTDSITLFESIRDEMYVSYWTEYHLLLNYYGIRYEEGKEYLLITTTYRPQQSSPIKFYYYAPLDGEYPYIEVYPGPIRYDATYFGADTKYVSKDEFVELVAAATKIPD